MQLCKLQKKRKRIKSETKLCIIIIIIIIIMFTCQEWSYEVLLNEEL